MQIQSQHSAPNSHYSQFGQLNNKPSEFSERSGDLGISCLRWIETGQLFYSAEQACDLLLDEEMVLTQSANYDATSSGGLMKELDNFICDALQQSEDQQTSFLANTCKVSTHYQWEPTPLPTSFEVNQLETLSDRFNELNLMTDKNLVDHMIEIPGARAIPQLEAIASFKHNPLLLAGVESTRLSAGFATFCEQMLSDIDELRVALLKDPDVLDAFRGVLFYSLDKIFVDAGATLEAMHKRSQDPLMRAHIYRLAFAANSLPVQEALVRLDMNHLPTVFGVLKAENFEDATSFNNVIGCLYFKSAKNAQYIRLCHELGPKVSGQRAAIESKNQHESQRTSTLKGRLSQKHIDLIVYGIKSKLTSSQFRQYINQLIEAGHMLPELRQ